MSLDAPRPALGALAPEEAHLEFKTTIASGGHRDLLSVRTTGSVIDDDGEPTEDVVALDAYLFAPILVSGHSRTAHAAALAIDDVSAAGGVAAELVLRRGERLLEKWFPWDEAPRGFLYLHELTVAPRWRGRRIGVAAMRALMRAQCSATSMLIVAVARPIKCAGLEIDALRRQERGLRNYYLSDERLHFKAPFRGEHRSVLAAVWAFEEGDFDEDLSLSAPLGGH